MQLYKLHNYIIDINYKKNRMFKHKTQTFNNQKINNIDEILKFNTKNNINNYSKIQQIL